MTQKPIHYTQSLLVHPPDPTTHVDTPDAGRILGLYRKEGLYNIPLEGLWYERWEDGTEWPIHGTHFVGCWNWRDPDVAYATPNDATYGKTIFSTETIFTVPAHAHITNVYFTTGDRFANNDETIVLALVIDVQQRIVVDIVPALAKVQGLTPLAIPVNRAYNMPVTIGIYSPGGVAQSKEDAANGTIFALSHEQLAVDQTTAAIGQTAVTSAKRPAIGIEYLVERPHTDPVAQATAMDRAVTHDRFPFRKTLIGHAGIGGFVYRQAFDLTTPNAVNIEQVIVPDSVDLLLTVGGTIVHPNGGNIPLSSVFGLIRHVGEKISIFPATEYFTNARYCVVLEWVEGIPT